MRGIKLGMMQIRGIRMGKRGIRVSIFVFIASAKILEAQAEHLSIQLLWAAARLSHTFFMPCLSSGWVLLQRNEDVESVQDFILLYLCLV